MKFMMTLPFILVVVRFGWRVLLLVMTLVCFFFFYPLNGIPFTSRCWPWHFVDTEILEETVFLKLLNEAVNRRSCKAEKDNLKIHSDQILLVVLVYFFIFAYAKRPNRHSSGSLLVEILSCNHSWGSSICRQTLLMFCVLCVLSSP